MSAGAPLPLKQFLDNRFGQLSAEIDGMVSESREKGQREFAERLNQIGLSNAGRMKARRPATDSATSLNRSSLRRSAGSDS